jgi:hypothetical protein
MVACCKQPFGSEAFEMFRQDNMGVGRAINSSLVSKHVLDPEVDFYYCVTSAYLNVDSNMVLVKQKAFAMAIQTQNFGIAIQCLCTSQTLKLAC